MIAYVTCSPHLAETKVIVEGALNKWGDAIHRIDTPEVVAGFTGETPDLPESQHVQLWPHRHSTDAMFIQLIGKAL